MSDVLLVGIDVGSTTTKLAAIDAENETIVYLNYQRHHAAQAESVRRILVEFGAQFPKARLKVCCTGSGAGPIAAFLHAPFLQEVVGNSIALRRRYRALGTAIELGGQDAKMLFFRKNAETGLPEVKDMRMNGSCAGGTGAFIDEIAALLRIPVEEFDALAAKGRHVYDISGRCGVYAKTDIQPLLNQGAAKADIALSSFHAIAKQTIGGLAQGLDIERPVVFEGGPLTFHPTLIRVFRERLQLTEEETLIPERPEMMMALGAAFSLTGFLKDKGSDADGVPAGILIERLAERSAAGEREETRRQEGDGKAFPGDAAKPFFASPQERAAFQARCQLPPPVHLAAGKPPIDRPMRAHTEVQSNREGCSTAAGKPPLDRPMRVFLGIDSGSTTTKFVLMDEEERLLDSFYAANRGDPLEVARKALLEVRDNYRAAGIDLQILAIGTTGYGERLFAKAFDAEYHTVETVAHARAVRKYIGDEGTTFILDIGGQDMKAIWLENGVIKDILINEACSSGCGSFLENYAVSLHIPTEKIAARAFDAKHPAQLGSRCTVFMNSRVITEQRNGKTSEDIIAGLCRSIIENVFTKVVRVANKDALGDRIVAQGGTFRNDAVLRALEEYLGREVIRSPYPELMGAIGAALLTREHVRKQTARSLDFLEAFSYTQQAGVACPFCANRCKRTVVRFSNGGAWITGNRCERGEVLGDPAEEKVRRQLREKAAMQERTPDLYQLRETLLFREYPYPQLLPKQNVVIGIPRVLSFWETMPFWTTFWRALGFTVRISDPSTRAQYENGLSAVMSDTVCFPAKLVHGHLRNLEAHGADRIFMPSITAVPSENTEETSESMCAIVKGYPIAVRNSDNPERRHAGHLIYDNPLFHWHTPEDRDRQLTRWMQDTFGIDEQLAQKAIRAGDAAQESFRSVLCEAGEKVLAQVRRDKTYAVVLAARPYQNDALVNHDLPSLFLRQGIPVLTADALPQINRTALDASRLDIVNNYHARMLSAAILAAKDDCLQYVQLVSFGCGHDAYLSDEITRLTREFSGGKKTPLILKLDESDISGPLQIRVRSFLETIGGAETADKALDDAARPDIGQAQERPTGSVQEQELSADGVQIQERPAGSMSERESLADGVQMQERPTGSVQEGAECGSGASDGGTDAAKRRLSDSVPSCTPTRSAADKAPSVSAPPAAAPCAAPPDPYPVKFLKRDRARATVLVPNTSHAFARMMAAVFARQGIRTVPLPIGGDEAIRLGKQYVHNDICFPAQIVIGEALAALQSGDYRGERVAIAMGKYVGDCRLTHYSALLRKALDDAGYADVPILTNDDRDRHRLHPGFRMNVYSALQIAYALPMIDILEELLRKIRPYELKAGSADEAFAQGMDRFISALRRNGIRGMRRGFCQALEIMEGVEFNREKRKPTVLIVGEYLLNFHPGANHDVERYLEQNGLEVIEARMTDVIRKTYFYQDAQIREYRLKKPLHERLWYRTANAFFDRAHRLADGIAAHYALTERACRLQELVKDSDPILHHTFDAGEGVLIPGEILHHAKKGCRNFIILQPFGCLPNHVVGRGISRKLKELYPDAQILSLDYDPDVSFANIENRLQMLVMNACV